MGSADNSAKLRERGRGGSPVFKNLQPNNCTLEEFMRELDINGIPLPDLSFVVETRLWQISGDPCATYNELNYQYHSQDNLPI